MTSPAEDDPASPCPASAFAALARLARLCTGCASAALTLVLDDRLQHHVADRDGVVESARDAAVDVSSAGAAWLPPSHHLLAQVPVRVQGRVLAVLGVADPHEHALGAEARAGLDDLAAAAAALVEARTRERDLRALEDRVRTASAAGSDWLWESDADGMLTWVSDSVEPHVGWPAEREVGVHSLRKNRPPPQEWRASWDRYRANRAARQPFRDAIAERDSVHGTMLISISGQPVFDADGSFRGYRGAARDVTAELAERARAQRDQQLLLQAIEALHAGVMISGPDGRVRLSNAAWLRQIGRYADPTNARWEALVRAMAESGAYPDARGRVEEFVRWRLGLASPQAAPHELRFLDRDVLVSDQLLPDGSIVHLSINVTEQRRAERELRASEARLAAVLHAVPDLWFVIDAQDRYLLCSDDRHPWLVAPFEQMRGRIFAQMLEPPLAAQGLAVLHQARRTGQVQRFEYELDTMDGRRRHFEARVSPMPEGQVLYLTRDLTDLRRLEREMQLMRRAIEADAAMPIVVCDATSTELPVVYANPAFTRLTGFSREEVLGRPCPILSGGDPDQAGLDTLRRALAQGEPCSVTLTSLRRDGSRFVNELQVAPIVDADGRPVQFLAVLKDASERVRAAERLRISEELYRSVAASISDGLLVVGQPGEVIAANPSACEMLGVGAEALIGRRLSDLGFELRTEDDRAIPLPEHPVARVLRGEGTVRDLPHRLHCPGGRVRLMQLTAHPLHATGSGSPGSCLVTFRDITDRRAAEQALAAAEARWRFALDGVGDGVWDHDEDTQTTFFSPRWKAMLGHAPHEIGASLKEWSRRIHPDDRARVGDAIRRYRAGELAEYRTEHRLRHKDGRWIWVLDRGKIVERHADGRPRRVVGTHTDITPLKIAEQALLDKQAAELASRAKSEFLSRMSHEMRTPLNAVLGFTQLLRLQPDGGAAKVAEYADHVLRASEHLLALVNEVLDLQRVEEGRVALEPEPLEIAPFVDTTLEMLRPVAERAGVALANQVPHGSWLRADARCLRQVLINVISNAIKYNGRGGWVCVGLPEAPPERRVLAIEDTGSGLDEDQLARVFQPFERLGRETSGIEGSGLGLVIARSLVQRMDGTLTLSSVPGAGTLARIDLPAGDAPADARPSAPAPAPAPAMPPPAAPLRLLYVEDNRINALLFEEAMRLLGGFDLRVAEDGAAALELVRDWTPDVLVLDAHLPDMNGFEVLARLRTQPELAALPAYMCSADAMPEDLQRAREAGFAGYWTKPIALDRVGADLDSVRRSA